MTIDHSFIASIYQSIGDTTPFSEPLERMAHRYGAKGSSIIFHDFAQPLVSDTFLSTYYRQPKTAQLVAQFMNQFAEDEYALVQRLAGRTERFHFLSDEEGYSLPSKEIPANQWNRANLGIDRRYAARLSSTPIWFDVLTLNCPTGHNGLTTASKADAKAYMLHFATALEIARPFALLQTRFNAVAAVLDKLKIGVALLTDNAEVTLKNNRFDNILQQKTESR